MVVSILLRFQLIGDELIANETHLKTLTTQAENLSQKSHSCLLMLSILLIMLIMCWTPAALLLDVLPLAEEAAPGPAGCRATASPAPVPEDAPEATLSVRLMPLAVLAVRKATQPSALSAEPAERVVPLPLPVPVLLPAVCSAMASRRAPSAVGRGGSG